MSALAAVVSRRLFLQTSLSASGGLVLVPGTGQKARAAFAGATLEIGALTPLLIERKPIPEPLQ